MKFGVEEHGEVSGEAAMMAEIAARGPIVCAMCVTDAFMKYTGGIYGCASSLAFDRPARCVCPPSSWPDHGGRRGC